MTATTPLSKEKMDTLFPEAAPGKGTMDDVALAVLPAGTVVKLVEVVVMMPVTMTAPVGETLVVW